MIQEIYALSLGHFVIRSLMFEAAATVNLDPDRLSFTGCFQILKCRLPECDGKTPATFEAWYQGLLWEMQGERTDPRRNRINLRVIKRKMSKWKKKRPEHRHRPPCKYSVNPSPALAFSRSDGYSRPSWTTDQPPCSVSRPCGSQSRNWHPSPLVRHRIPRHRNPFVPPRLSPSAPVRFARG